MPRGRPKKIQVVEDTTPKTIQWLIAEVAHDYCGMPGCQTRMHLDEASDIIDKLSDNGYIIKEGN